jgi:hypothetical protein
VTPRVKGGLPWLGQNREIADSMNLVRVGGQLVLEGFHADPKGLFCEGVVADGVFLGHPDLSAVEAVQAEGWND